MINFCVIIITIFNTIFFPQTKETQDKLPLFAIEAEVVSAPGLLPKPASVTLGEGIFRINYFTVLQASGNDALSVANYFNRQCISPFEVTNSAYEKNVIRFLIDPAMKLPAEGYRLSVDCNRIEITGKDRAGLFYGMQTLLQLFPKLPISFGIVVNPVAVAAVEIEDYPRFSYRGMHLDVARTFSTKERVMRYIDNLARHKLNYFHWHLTDDEGWRIEIKSHPALAKQGGFRGEKSPVRQIYGRWDELYGGYYTQDEIREVVAYASERNITIIPEIDLPGHSRTVARVYPKILCSGKFDTSKIGYDNRNVWCVAKEQNYKILDDILKEVSDLFPSKHIHIGGDEVLVGQWNECPECKKLVPKAKGRVDVAHQLTDIFIEKLTETLKKYGKTPVVWNEAVHGGKLSKKSVVSGWENIDAAKKALSAGYKTIIMPGEYFYYDMAQTPEEPGLSWAGIVSAKRSYNFDFTRYGFTTAQMANVWGVQGAFWAEKYIQYDIDYLDYQTNPRIAALAELGWTQQKLCDWDDFYARLTSQHLERLDRQGIRFHIDLPEVNYEKGVITASVPHNGCEVRYTTDGTAPNVNSLLYVRPIADTLPESYKFATVFRGRASYPTVPKTRHNISVSNGGSQTVELEIPQIADRKGTWQMRIMSSELGLTFSNFGVKTSVENQIIKGKTKVNEARQYRIYIDSTNMDGTLFLTIDNPTANASDVVLEFERSPYLETPAKLTSSMEINRQFSLEKATDYNFASYTRTTRGCKNGDYFLFTFTKPTDGQSIEVRTGLSYLARYQIEQGYVEVSYDGTKVAQKVALENGVAIITPEQPVKSLKVVSTMNGNGEGAVAIQDPKILRKF